MKNKIIILSVVLAPAVLFPQSSNAQWVQTASLQGGSISAMLVNGATILAKVQGSGIYRSLDNGTTWTTSDSGMYTDEAVSSFAQLGDIIFAGITSRFVATTFSTTCMYRSSDNGLIWDSCGLDVPVYSLATKGGAIFAGTTSGVYLSNDTGKSWIAANSGLPANSTIFSLAAIGTNMIAGTNMGIYLSSKNGTSWTPAGSGQSIADTFFALASSGNSVFAGTNNGVYRSSDSGSTWVTSNAGFPTNLSISATAVIGSTIFAGSKNSGLYFSSNNGTNWIKANTGFARTPVLSIIADDPKVFVGTDGAGIIETADSGKTWSSISSGLPFKAQINSIETNGTNIFAGTPMGIFLSKNNGDSWSPVNSGLPENNQTYSFTANAGTVFVGTAGYSVFASSNNGATWNAANNGLTNNYVSSIKPNGAFLYAGTKGGVFISVDTGKSWSPINNGFVDTSVTSLAVGNGKLFALMQGSRVYSSIDNGQHWNAGYVFSGISSGSSIVTAFDASGNNLLIGSYQRFTAADYGQGVSQSTDNGITFTAANTGLPLDLWVNDFTNQGNTIFIGTGSGVFASNNVDFNWAALNSGLPVPPNFSDNPGMFIQHLAINETHLFAIIDGESIWRLPLSSVAIQRNMNNSPDRLALKLSFPNRLDPNVVISFSLIHSEQVTVKIYNVSGQEIATLVDKNLGSGSHSFSWNTRNIATGCYTIRIQAGTNIYVKSIPIFR